MPFPAIAQEEAAISKKSFQVEEVPCYSIWFMARFKGIMVRNDEVKEDRVCADGVLTKKGTPTIAD